MKPAPPLSPEEISASLALLPQWSGDQHGLARSIQFESFADAMAFLAAAGLAMEARNHHATWTNCFRQLDITLNTHDAGNRVTARDVALAGDLEALLSKEPAQASDRRRLLLISSSSVHGYGYLDYCMADILSFFEPLKNLLFVPFALDDHDAYADTVRARFARENVQVASLHQAEDAALALQEAEAIFVGGGNTFRLLNTLYQRNLIGALRHQVLAGTPYMGTSAGSNLACPTIMTTNDMPIVQPPSFTALNLVPFQLNPHYLDPDPSSKHKGETRETRLREYHEMNDAAVVGLREGGMLRVQGDAMTLEGIAGARLFCRGKEPSEFDPGADLSHLLT